MLFGIKFKFNQEVSFYKPAIIDYFTNETIRSHFSLSEIYTQNTKSLRDWTI